MHGATTATDAAVPFAIDLGHHGLQVSPLGKIVRVGAMAAEETVAGHKHIAHADGGGFLADGKMHRATHFLFGIALCNGLFDQTDAQHLFQAAQPVVVPGVGRSSSSGVKRS